MTEFRIFGAPHRYIQGAGAISRLPEVVHLYGRKPLIVADAVITSILGTRVAADFAQEAPVFADFGGECTAGEIDRIAQLARNADVDVVVGAGGGKAIDTAKGVRHALNLPLVIVPTIASNDSPTSRLAVLYSEEHVLTEVRLMRTNPDAVLVDTAVIVQAPPRYFIAGIGDALSKKFEAGQCASAGGTNFYGGKATRLALTVADCCFDILMGKSEEAVVLVREGRGGPVVEEVIEATILMSGLAFESGGLSIAHALQRGFTRLPHLSAYLHGELVALGLLVQLAAERREDRVLEDVAGLCGRLGLPTALSDVGVDISDAGSIARTSIEAAPYIGNFSRPVTANLLCEAFSRLEEMRRG